MAGLFSSAINLPYLSSPLYLMQVYNPVLVSEIVTTLVMLTLILTITLATMGLFDTARSQLLIRFGARLDALISRRLFEAIVGSGELIAAEIHQRQRQHAELRGGYNAGR